MSDYFVGEMLDDLAESILALPDRGVALRWLRVNPHLYDVISAAKARELARGNPLLILGMEVVRADGVPPSQPQMS
jgi:hypothetical protein